MPSRLAVLIVADLVDYTRMMSEDEALAIGTIRELKEEYLEPPVVKQGGEILKRMGDGWIIAFSSVTRAMQSAIGVQESVVAHPLIKLRMGMHIGEIVEDDTDFYGASVNLAQRLQTEAPPGGIMISQDLHRQLTGELAKAFTDVGKFNLKNISLPVQGFQWRPQVGRLNQGEVPTINVEALSFAPNDTETEAIAADLRDDLIVRLSKRSGIRVVDDVRIGENNATYVLRGRLRVSGNRGRLNLAMVNCENGNSIWTQSYDGDTGDIFEFCDAIVEKSVADLRIQINAFDNDRIAHLPDDQLSISELRSRAASNFYKCTMDSWRYSRKLLERAVQLNPSDPMALAMRAHASVILAAAQFGKLADLDIEQVRSDLDRAVELAPRSDFVFCARSIYRTLLARDQSGALRDANKALELNSGYHIAFDARAMARMLAGEFDFAIGDLERALELSGSDPLLPLRYYLLAISHHLAGRHQEAADSIEQAMQLRAGQHSYAALLADIADSLGDEAKATRARNLVASLSPAPSIVAPRPPLSDRYAELIARLSPEVTDSD